MAINRDMTPQTLGLYSEPLTEFRASLDEILKMLIVNMTERDLETGTVTAKIKVTMKKEISGQQLPATLLKIEPDISMKIGAKGTKKCEEQNGIYLRYDTDGVPVIAGSQISLEEYIRNKDDGAA